MLRPDIRRENRGAHRKPADIPSGEKVLAARPLVPCEPEADREHNQEVHGDDAPVKGRENHGFLLGMPVVKIRFSAQYTERRRRTQAGTGG
jgi:hypothetical protein